LRFAPNLFSQNQEREAKMNELKQAFLEWRDDDEALTPAFIARVTLLIDKKDAPALRALLEDAHEADMGDLLEALNQETRPKLIALLGDAFDYTALTEVDEGMRAEILNAIPVEQVVDGLADIDSDDAVYILEDLDEEDKAEILDRLPTPERLAVQRSLDYPEGSAARRMKTDVIAIPPFWNIGQTIDYLRETQDLPENFTEVFVIDPSFHLVGLLSLDKILRNTRPKIVSDVMEEPLHIIETEDEQTDVARLFERYNLISAPVVDASKRLVGVLTIDDIVDVLEEEADSDIKSLGGVNAQEEFSDNVMEIFKLRFSWLFVNMLTAFLASAVIAYFEGSLKQMVALAILMPIVASMGGNAGTQTMTVAVRALATQELQRSQYRRFIRRELLVGLCNGIAFALLISLVAYFWFPTLALWPVIFMAVIFTLLSAALGGIVMPLILNYYKVDPAVASGPLVTTITDVVGFFSFLGFATWWFGLKLL
jgi:magnesium transporter